MHEVRRARSEDAVVVARTLARAFTADPVACYLFPWHEGREAALSRFFAIQLEQSYLRRGEVWVEGSLRGAALWMPPGAAPGALGKLRIQLALLGLLRGRFGGARRLARLLSARHPGEPHYYLGTLGTDPSCQGQGIGTALVAPVLERCDRTSVPAYLESSRRENVPFYESQGFAVVEEVAVPGGPSLWLMWRPPTPSPGVRR